MHRHTTAIICLLTVHVNSHQARWAQALDIQTSNTNHHRDELRSAKLLLSHFCKPSPSDICTTLATLFKRLKRGDILLSIIFIYKIYFVSAL
ncbi:hypothetical protein BDB00DRAFT_845249 [Zychaea mexicana]|uniref:uncharacterized protein n=1 Tax=Zychaea mexicana TaxID=64656 RepID=UPI0022FE4CF1|nr:uncharacterized protein BDB00DRAFT_845249 [Zychaea mexicana]KAI9489123.1 hypothetical protein BDB00DRAFT_845249 [Zychaea mexicana]